MKCVQPSLRIRSWISSVQPQSRMHRFVRSTRLQRHAAWVRAVVVDGHSAQAPRLPRFRWICFRLVWWTTIRRCLVRQRRSLLPSFNRLSRQLQPRRLQPSRHASQCVAARALPRRPRPRLRLHLLQSQPRSLRQSQRLRSQQGRRPRRASNRSNGNSRLWAAGVVPPAAHNSFGWYEAGV